MKIITKYKAYDGTEFDSKSRCEQYELNCRRADDIISALRPKPKDNDCKFANGEGFVQHDLDLIFKIKSKLLKQANREHRHKWFKQTQVDPTAHPSWAARIINECCTGQLDNAWNRIMCIDSKGREWGQPFYANNPEKAPGKFEIK